MSEQYKVVFTGELAADREPDQIVNEFAERFKCSPEKARSLVLAGRDVVVKSGLDQVKAGKYQAVLQAMGMGVELISLQKAPLFEMEDDSGASDNGAATDSEAAPSRCPKCGSERIKDGNCLGCGIIISKYLALQASEQGSATVHNGSQQGSSPQPNQSTGPDYSAPAIAQTASDNPYQAPEADLTQGYEEGDLNGPASVPAAHGWRWLKEGFGHFRMNPLAWILTLIVWVIISVVLSLVPFIGSLAITLISPVIGAGFMLGCREQEQGGDFRISHLFSGFSNNVGQLMLVGLLYLVGTIVIVVAIALFAGGAVFLLGGGNPGAMGPEMMSAMAIPILIAFLLFIPLLMAYWFAPALVALNDVSAISAMKMSFSACLKNMLPFLVYGLLATLLSFIAVIPFGLGMLVLLPMVIASMYTAYRDIFYS